MDNKHLKYFAGHRSIKSMRLSPNQSPTPVSDTTATTIFTMSSNQVTGWHNLTSENFSSNNGQTPQGDPSLQKAQKLHKPCSRCSYMHKAVSVALKRYLVSRSSYASSLQCVPALFDPIDGRMLLCIRCQSGGHNICPP